MKSRFISIFIAASVVFACGGGKDEEPTVKHQHGGETFAHQQGGPVSLGGDTPGAQGIIMTQPHPETSNVQKVKRTIFVPDEVKGKWKAVKLEIKEKTEGGYNEIKTVSIGDEFDIPGSNIHVKVGEFLPHLSIGETAFTSLSNEPVNPAVNLIITEDGKELYNGWAYSKFPHLYNFQHDKFSVILTDFIPVSGAHSSDG